MSSRNLMKTAQMQKDWVRPSNLGIQWLDELPDRKDWYQGLSHPHTEITRPEYDYLRIESSILGTDYGQYFIDMEKKGDPTGYLWSCNFYWLLDKGLVECHFYMNYDKYIGNSRYGTNPQPSFNTGKGEFLHEPSGEYGYAMRYFKMGCSHPNMKENSTAMFYHIYTCPDCGLSYGVDSSG